MSGMLGRRHTPETKAKMSLAQTGHTVSAETRKNIGEASRGRFVSAETRRKIGLAGTGRVPSEAHRQKSRISMLGHKVSVDTRKKIAKSLTGRAGRRGELNKNWRGGRFVNKRGYVMIRINGKKFLEHRIVMESVLGRSLSKNENIHHKNGIKTDNRPENLELWITSQPSGVRMLDVLESYYDSLVDFATTFGVSCRQNESL